MEAQLRTSTSFVNLNPHYQGRVRSGCLTCRKKKVKCDEQHPTCRRCIRLKRECVYQTKAVPHANGALVDRDRAIECQRQARHSYSLSRFDGSNQHLMSPSSNHPTPCGSNDVGPPLEDYWSDGPLPPRDSGISLPSIHEVSQSQSKPIADSAALSVMTSQDIYLCTTIDWLAANECLQAVSFSSFLNEIDLPLLTSFDPWNWTHMKAYAVSLASQHRSMAVAISAVQLLWRAQTHSLPTTNAISRYEVARRILEADLRNDAKDFSTILLTAFLLSLFSIVLLDETNSILAQHAGNFVARLESWSRSGLRTPIVSRIAAWLKIMHAAARRGGNQGIMSAKVHDLLSDQYEELPSLSALAPHHSDPAAHESVSPIIFRFYLSLQCLSLQVANMSHYHRSRRTAADQEEVVRLMGCLKAELHSLWLTRPAILRCDPDEIRDRFSTETAELLINQAAISIASYHAEFVDIDRSLGDPLSLTPEAEEGLRWIESLVEANRNVGEKLGPGLLRPLFMYAIEHENSTNAQWALDCMKEIKDPIARSDFFASYAQALVEEQRIKKRRVTTRWFCYERYGVRPPFL